MNEERDYEAIRNRLGFMFKAIPVSKIALNYWMTVPAFLDAMAIKLLNHESINSNTVLPIMEEIYYRDFEPIRLTPAAKHLNCYLARKAINQLRRAVSEDE